MRFSERKSFTPIKNIIQTASMDADLRNGLWNALSLYYWQGVTEGYGLSYQQTDRPMSDLCRSMWLNYFKQPLDTLPRYWQLTYDHLRKYFFACEWYEAYDFVEFVPCNCKEFPPNENAEFRNYCNRILERELSAYRFLVRS